MTRRDISHIGRYEIQRRLGVGGMGALYLARDPSLDRLVAIKLLRDDFQDNPALRERFIREARSVARLRHPNIVIVYDVGEDDGRPFMAMEYIAGETLSQVLNRKPSLPVTKRLELVEDLCAGLAHAHAAGIIHRDIKPTNIMLDSDGVLKILDFGIARIVNSGMTQEGMMMGTLNYMSPEQVAGRGVDRGTDIFATGAVLYEVLALEQAFPERLDTGILKKILSDGPVPLERKVPDIDPELAAIVRKALEPDPTRRYRDAMALRQDLTRVRRRLAESEPFSTGDAVRKTALFEPPPPTPAKSDPKVESDRPRRLSPERLAELRRQQVEEHVRFGEEAFARGEHDAALHYAERAATVDPDNREAIDLLDRARLAIEGKAIRRRLDEAHRLLADGHLDEAAALAEEASATLPDIHGSADLRREVRQAIEKIAEIRQREQRIATALDRAQQSLEQGAYDTALRAVYEVLALDPDRPKARALEQDAKARLHAQREHERSRRSAYDSLARAETLAGQGQFDAAIAEISAVSAPSDTVRVAAATALANVRNAQRRATHAAMLAKAQASFDRGDLEEAHATIDSIPGEERTARARALQIEVAKALEARRLLEQKRQALEVALQTIEGLVAQDNLTRALESLDEAAAIGIDDGRIAALRNRITDLVTAADNKRRQEARDREAAKQVEAAKRLLASGDGHAAITLLERDDSAHPLVKQALGDIRAAVAEHEERVRQEAERRRHEEEERRRAEAEARRKLEEQRKAEEERRAEERRRQRDEEERRREEQRQREAEARRREEEERQREAEARRQEEERRLLEARREQEERRAREERARQEAEADAARLRAQQQAEAEQRRRDEEEEAARTELTRQTEELAAGERELLEQQARDAQAASIADHAKQLFASGQHDEALALLRGADEHQAIRGAIEELEWLAQIHRQRRQERADPSRKRRAARALVLRKAVVRRRLRVAGAAVLGVTIALVIWRLLPAPSPMPEIEARSLPVPWPIDLPVRPVESAPPRPLTNDVGDTTNASAAESASNAAKGATPLPPPDNVVVVTAEREVPQPVEKQEVRNANPGGGATQPQSSKQNPDAVVVNPPPRPQPQVPPPPRVDIAAETAAIQQLLNRYVAAYNALDGAQLKRIDPRAPNLPDRVLLESVDMRASDVSIDVSSDGQTATLRATQTVKYVWKRRYPDNPPGVLSWKLRKVGGAWTVLP